MTEPAHSVGPLIDGDKGGRTTFQVASGTRAETRQRVAGGGIEVLEAHLKAAPTSSHPSRSVQCYQIDRLAGVPCVPLAHPRLSGRQRLLGAVPGSGRDGRTWTLGRRAGSRATALDAILYLPGVAGQGLPR